MKPSTSTNRSACRSAVSAATSLCFMGHGGKQLCVVLPAFITLNGHSSPEAFSCSLPIFWQLAVIYITRTPAPCPHAPWLDLQKQVPTRKPKKKGPSAWVVIKAGTTITVFPIMKRFTTLRWGTRFHFSLPITSHHSGATETETGARSTRANPNSQPRATSEMPR